MLSPGVAATVGALRSSFANGVGRLLADASRSAKIISPPWRRFSDGNPARNVEERKISVGDVSVNYAKVGTGNHPVLLLPGALGTIWTDFKPQINNLGSDKLTIVAWDPPGYGKSRPPDRTFPDDFFQRDAKWARDLMHALGYPKFSLVGWSDGGITSLLLASAYPDDVRKMIVVGANAYVMPEELKVYESIRDVNTWSERMRAPLIEAYGEEYFQRTWSAWVDAMTRLFKKQNGDLCKGALAGIKCPTLVVHGARDIMVHGDHPVYLKDHIKGARLHIFEKGSHNLHLRYHEEFNALVQDFLQERSTI